MRDAITNALAQIETFGGRVFDPHAADKRTAKPYLVVTFLDAGGTEPWAEWRQPVEIWVCGSRTTFSSLDDLCMLVIEALHLQTLTAGEQSYTCALTDPGSGDAVDDEWDIIYRAVRFDAFGITQLGAVDPGTSDPWETALATWTATLEAFGGWAISTSRWTSGVAIPALLWRVEEASASPDTTGSILLTKRMAGHLRGHGVTEQTAAGVLLVAELMQAKKILLDEEARTYLTIGEPRYSTRADGKMQPQLIVPCTRKISPAAAADDAELLAALHLSYDLK